MDCNMPLCPKVTVYEKVNGFHLVEVQVKDSFCERFYVSEKGDLLNPKIDDEFPDNCISAADFFDFEKLTDQQEKPIKPEESKKLVEPEPPALLGCRLFTCCFILFH